MKTIIIKTQNDFNSLPNKFDEYTIIEIRSIENIIINHVARENSSVEARENSSVVAWENSSVVARENSSVEARGNSSVVARENSSVEACGNSSVVARENSSVVAWENSSVVAWGNSSVVARGNSSVVARENSSVVARENSSVEARGNSSVVARENSSVVARENSSVEAWGNSSVVARENSSVVAWENSSVEARENSSVVAWGNSLVRIFSELVKIVLNGFSVAFVNIDFNIKIEKSENSYIQYTKKLDWYENNAIEKKDKLILYKKVSKNFQTQENTKNETLWQIGNIITHLNWNPTKQECGEGKFHACSKPYFCDEFRNKKGDRYIVIEVSIEDIFIWENNPSYPHKIAFRECIVLFECDKFGNKL